MLLKCQVPPPPLIYRFYAILIRIPASYCLGFDKLILKFIQKNKRYRIAKIILKEKNKIRELTLLNFKVLG